MMNKSFISFKELIDHELPNDSVTLTLEGYKLDSKKGDSLKKYCNFNDLKSADYLISNNGKVYVVEFSDILLQQCSILDKVQKIKASELEKGHKKEICEEYFCKIVQEMKDKFKDTHTIYGALPQYFNDLDAEFYKHYDKCFLVISNKPLEDPSIDKSRQMALMRFLSTLAARITNSIPDHINTRVVIRTIDQIETAF